MAPLSVHRPGRGTRSVIPAASQRCWASARSRELAATPPPSSSVSIPRSRAARTAFAVSTSTTASWKDAATSATGTGVPARCSASTCRATAVFSPEKEKSNAASRGPVRPRGNATARRVAVAGHPVDVRAARERQPEQPGHLVERLAGGVVDGGAERGDRAGQVGHVEQAGVAAGHQQGQARRQRAVLQGVHRDVRGQVVHPVQRHLPGRGVGLGRGHPDQQRPGQPRAGGDRDRGHVRRPDPGRGQRAVHGRDHRLQVGPGGDLGDHAAEAGVLLHRGGDLVGQQGRGGARLEADDPDPGLVAGGLDPEDDHRGSRRMV